MASPLPDCSDVRLLGREREFDTLRTALSGAKDGRGGAVLVEGVAGVGRSSLLRAAGEHAGELGLTVVEAACQPVSGDGGFALARQLLEPLLGRCDGERRAELFAGAAAAAAPVFDGAAGPSRGGWVSAEAVHGLHRLLGRLAGESAVAIVVDDVQWADESSLLTLGYLAREIARLPVALILGVRSGEPGSEEAVVELAADASTTVLRPQPLGETEVAELVRERLGDSAARRSFNLTGGNPLLVQTLVEHERDAETALVEWVRRRLYALDGEAFAFARALALLGGPQPLERVAVLAELDAASGLAAAEALGARGLVERGGSEQDASARVAFAQPLLSAAVCTAIPPYRRALGHARAAVLLRSAGAPAAAVADQLLRSQPIEEEWAVDLLRAETRRAVAAGKYSRAAALLARTLDEPVAAADRPGLLARLERISRRVAASGLGESNGAAGGDCPADALVTSAAGPMLARRRGGGDGQAEDTALAALDARVVATRRAGDTAGERAARGERAPVGFLAGRLDEAAADAEFSLLAEAASEPWFGPAAVTLVAAHLERGERATAASALGELVRRAGDAPEPADHLRLARCHLDATRGDLAGALAGFHALAGGPLEGCGGLLSWRLAAAEISWALGDPAAAGLADAELERAQAAGNPTEVGYALRVAGLVTADPELQRTRQAEAVAALRAVGAHIQLAWALFEQAVAEPAGNWSDTRAALREAAALADDSGATLLAGRTREELVRAGGHDVRPPRGGPRMLTVAERTASMLAARGLAVEEIAARRVLDAATVSDQLRRAREKLGRPA